MWSLFGLFPPPKPRGPGDPLVDPPPTNDVTWMKFVGAVWVVNFLAFSLISTYLGGDAFNGYVKDGHYFLRGHGHITEVTRDVFEYSWWHMITVLVSALLFPLAYVADRFSAR